MMEMIRKILILSLIFGILFLAVVSMPSSLAQQEQTIEASTLQKEYFDNHVAADEKYTDKIVNVKGKILLIEPSSSEEHYNIFLEGRWSTGQSKSAFMVMCRFDLEHKSELFELKSEDRVTINGYCKGQPLPAPHPDVIWFIDCSIIEVEVGNGNGNSNSGCFIATATYESELSPQVQFLRGFRDNAVLSTFAGNQFMKVFNSFYYSFSPDVADSIRGDNTVRSLMKGVLYPLVGVLQVSETVFSALSFNPELAIVTTGFVASAFIAGIYFLPLSLVISYLRKKTFSKSILSATGLIWLASLTAIIGAELTQSSAVMMTATGVFVLMTMSLTVLSMTTLLPSLLKKGMKILATRFQ
jgi:peptide/nickel transport system substrate-binding protein